MKAIFAARDIDGHGTGAGRLRREPRILMRVKKGSYFGTEIDGKWWKRYRAATFFARGNGEFSMDTDGIHFLRTLTSQPLSISWTETTEARLGKSHAGRWAMGRPILKVGFVRDGQSLTAGFSLSSDWEAMQRLADDLQRKMAR
jgi:hypothetical protein